MTMKRSLLVTLHVAAFMAMGATAPKAGAAWQDNDPETVFWQSIMNSDNPAEFEAYLAQFPDGVFRPLAELRLGALRAAEQAAAQQRDAQAAAEQAAVETAARAEAQAACRELWQRTAFATATVEQVTECLEIGTDPAARFPDGRTVLHYAVESNQNPEIVEALLDAGADLETPDAVGLTPLHLAAVHTDDPAVFEVLLKAGSDVTMPEQVLESTERSIEILMEAGTDPTHLDLALESVMTDLAGAGVDVSNDVAAQALRETVQAAVLCEDWNTTAYFETAIPDQVAACLATGAVDLTARGAKGLTPLQAAAVESTNPGVIEVLLASGADHTATSILVESGRLEAGDEAPLSVFSTLPWYQDSYSFEGGFETVVVEAESDDDAPTLDVRPSGALIGYHLGDGRSLLSLTLAEFGEYRVEVSDIVFDGDPVDYTLRVTGEAPGYLAARYNENPAILRVFLNAGFDLDHKKADGSTLLHAAARNNENLGVVRALLAAGADVNEDDDYGRMPLHLAAGGNENMAVIQALLAAGVNVNEDDDDGWTPLHHAARNNENLGVIRALLAAGANVNEDDDDGWTPLHHAARFTENPATVEVLLAVGANIEATADDGFKALHFAAYNQNPAVAQTLLDAGAELRPSAGFFRDTPLRLAARSNPNPEVVQVLLDAGAEVNDGTFNTGNTAVHYAAHNDPAVILTLLDAGGGLEVENDTGQTPLLYAAEAGRPDVIETLLAVGADPTKEDGDDSTAVHLAARHNANPAVLEALLAAGLDLEARDDEERTPLNLAARYNENPAVVEALLAAGADIEAVDEDGRTPLSRATDENDNPGVREALLRAGAGQTERQRAAERSNSGPGLLGTAIGLVGGAAIVAAGEGSDEALAAGVDFAAAAIEGRPPVGGAVPAPAGAAAGDTVDALTGGQCQVPGYPTPPGGVANLGLPWCPARVSIQRRAFALQAAGAWCAIDGGSSSTAEQIQARHEEINAACDALDAMQSPGIPTCQCPPGYRP